MAEVQHFASYFELVMPSAVNLFDQRWQWIVMPAVMKPGDLLASFVVFHREQATFMHHAKWRFLRLHNPLDILARYDGVLARLDVVGHKPIVVELTQAQVDHYLKPGAERTPWAVLEAVQRLAPQYGYRIK